MSSPTPGKIIKLEPAAFKRVVKDTTKLKSLQKLEQLALAKENETYAAIIKKRITKLVRSAGNQEDFGEFKARVNEETRFSTLNRYRRDYANSGDEARLKLVNRRMQEILKNGGIKTRTRKEGTGERVEKTFTYSDSPSNRKLNRAGVEYKKWVWEGAEYVEVDRKIRKRRIKREKTEDEPPKKKNMWIEAVQRAKVEFEAPAFLIVRREAKDPEDPIQQIGVRVYKRALEIMVELKEKAQSAASEVAEPEAPTSSSVEAATE
jgi:hypothetical protein